jgi:hypothetical protein
MLKRLYFADLVSADMTIPNGNVCYELGIRHAAPKTGRVCLRPTGRSSCSTDPGEANILQTGLGLG